MIQINNKTLEGSIKRKFINPLKHGAKHNLHVIESNIIHKNKEALDLLKQCDKTLYNVEHLIKSNNFVDANALNRSALDYLMMGMMINYDESFYEQYKKTCISDVKGVKRITDKTLISKFSEFVNNNDIGIMNDTTVDENSDMIQEIYHFLCKYTHSSLFISIIINSKKDDEIEVLRLISNQYLYINRLLLFYCLTFITKDGDYYIRDGNILFALLSYYYIVKSRVSNFDEVIKRFEMFLYKSDNMLHFMERIKKSEKAAADLNECKKDTDMEELNKQFEEFLK